MERKQLLWGKFAFSATGCFLVSESLVIFSNLMLVMPWPMIALHALVGIELLTIDARIVIASVDTYLRFAEAVNRLDMEPRGQVSGLPGLVREIAGDDDEE
jgi:hypothetical protein